MKKLSYLIVVIAILVMLISVALAQEVGEKFEWGDGSVGTCIMMYTGDGGVQYWWTFNETYTFTVENQPWLEPDNDLIGTSGTKLHTVGKLQSSMTIEKAIKRGFDATWEDWYVKYNWME